MPDARELTEGAANLVERLREREKDLRSACEYVGGGVKGVIYAEVAENTKEAADEIERLTQELESWHNRYNDKDVALAKARAETQRLGDALVAVQSRVEGAINEYRGLLRQEPPAPLPLIRDLLEEAVGGY